MSVISSEYSTGKLLDIQMGHRQLYAGCVSEVLQGDPQAGHEHRATYTGTKTVHRRLIGQLTAKLIGMGSNYAPSPNTDLKAIAERMT